MSHIQVTFSIRDTLGDNSVNYRILALALALSALTSGRARPDDFMRTAPRSPKGPDCVGINENMPPQFAAAVRDINKKYSNQSSDAQAAFEKQTDETGKQWEREHGATVQRYVDALKRANYPAAPFSPTKVTSREDQHRFEVQVARWKLETVKAENREREEEAEERLRFALHGGNTVALDVFETTISDIVAGCKKDGDRVYQSWWDSEKK